MNYEFKDSTDPYDRNWLLVEIIHKSGVGEKVFQSPCLLTWELARIRDAFHSPHAQRKLDFMEPELEFIFREGEVFLELRYGLRFGLDEVEIYKAFLRDKKSQDIRDTLDELCRKFPVRGELPFSTEKVLSD